MRKLISFFVLFSFSLHAATITDNKLNLGRGQVDKSIIFDRGGSNAQIKWNETSDKLQFSNDGSVYKNLGSGTGGASTGVNVLTNDSFEDAVGGVISDWTNTGGTLTQQTYANAVEGDEKYFQFVATGSGQYFEMVKTVPTNFSVGCQVDFKKLNIATANLFKVEALDGSNNVLASANVGVLAWAKFPTLSFACPSAGSTFKIRVTSLAAGTLQGDTAYLGSNQNVIQSIYTEDYDWTTVTVTGTWTTNTTYLAKEKRIGDTAYYKISVNTSGAPNATQLFINLPSGRVIDTAKIPNAVNSLGAMDVYKSGSGWNPAGIITYNSTTQLRPYYGIGDGGVTGPLTLGNITQSTPFVFAAGDSVQLNFSVPIVGWSNTINKTQAISNDQSSWFIDANIGGSNSSLGTGSVSSYSPINDGSLDLVLNTSKGSAGAEISCAPGTASSGLNCGGSNESIGIAFIPPSAGLYEACFDFTHYTDLAVNGLVFSTFQVIETPNTSATILTEGGAKIMSGASYGTSANGGLNSNAQKVCGTFNFSDTSKRTLRLMYEQTTIATVGQNDIRADRNAGYGQRDIKVSVRPLLSAYNRPVLTGDQVTTKGANKPIMFGFTVGSDGVLNSQFGNYISSCAKSSPGIFYCNFATSFATSPVCIADSRNSLSYNQGVSFVSAGTSKVDYITVSGGSAVDMAVGFICMGVSN